MRKLPTNWKFRALSEICIISGGNGFPEIYQGRTGLPFLFMKVSDMNLEGNETYIYKTVNTVDESLLKQIKGKTFPKNTIVLPKVGGALLTNKRRILTCETAIDNNCMALIPNEVDHNFLYNWTLLIDLAKYSQSGALPSINASDLGEIEIPLPPLSEQKKIAEILSTWDLAIETCEKLISAKQTRKRALAQRLLTGKQRFPQFAGQAWENLHIRDIAREISAKNKDGSQLTVLSCTKHKGLVDSLSYFGKRIFSENLSTYKIVKCGQFAYATNHIEEGSIGYQDLYDKALISPMYTVFETNNKVDDGFLYKLLKTETYRHTFEAMTSGSINRRGSLRWNGFKLIKIRLPSLEEQKRIAEVLSACDKEIELLEKQRDSLKQQKRGLMQKLLTGKVRVKVDEIEENSNASSGV